MFGLPYLKFRSVAEVGIVMLSPTFALAGGAWLMWWPQYNMSTAFTVGFIALAGVAAKTAVTILVYLDDAYRDRLGAGMVRSRADIDAAVTHGAVERVRPRMTIVTASLVPSQWSIPTDASVMKRIASQVNGGMIAGTMLTLLASATIGVRWEERVFRDTAASNTETRPSNYPAAFTVNWSTHAISIPRTEQRRGGIRCAGLCVFAETAGSCCGERITNGRHRPRHMNGMRGMMTSTADSARDMHSMMNGVSPEVQSQLRSMNTIDAATMRSLVPGHLQMVSSMLLQMNGEMRRLLVTGGAGWTALVDSIRRDLRMMPGRDIASMRSMMPEHSARIRQLGALHTSMMAGAK